MTTHYKADEKKTMCGRKITRYAVNGWWPTLSLSTNWVYVNCKQCLIKHQTPKEAKNARGE